MATGVVEKAIKPKEYLQKRCSEYQEIIKGVREQVETLRREVNSGRTVIADAARRLQAILQPLGEDHLSIYSLEREVRGKSAFGQADDYLIGARMCCSEAREEAKTLQARAHGDTKRCGALIQIIEDKLTEAYNHFNWAVTPP